MLTSTRLVRPPYSYNKPSTSFLQSMVNSSCNQWLWHDFTTVTKLITGRTSSHTIKVCIVGTNCICTYALNICVCTRGIVYELFHTHLTKHHIICHRLPQLIIHFARKVSHHEWWWIHFTVSSDLDDYFSIISTKHRSCESDVSICTASACCLYTSIMYHVIIRDNSFSVIRNT